MRKLLLPFVVALAAVAVAFPASALASPPANDAFASASAIGSLPFTDSVDTSQGTTEAGEPSGGCPSYGGGTVWYTFTPSSNEVVRVDTSASNYNNTVNVYSGTSLNTLNYVACNYWYSPVTFHAAANTTYYIQVGNYFSTGTLNLSVSMVPPPTNDNFANASVISPGALPFTDSESALASTTEAGEPDPSCAPGQISNSWWYSFTPTATGSFTATTSSGTWVTAAAYTGSSLSTLSQVACRSQGGAVLTFKASAGTTYYLQISDVYAGNYGPISISFDHAAQPVANFFYSPGDPSMFDTVQFYNQSYDPGQAGFVQETYNFGDGSSAAGCCPNQIGGGPDASHQYVKDGDYTVTDTLTTADGRVATAQQVIHVRTHDVSISKFAVPQTAKVGQTRPITVSISNSRYSDTVQVQLLKSQANGNFVTVGTLTQTVPVRNKATDFPFNYTFTSDDGTAGKVTFEAIATITSARDALPADNTAIALPTTVNP
jgi:hypothetical protein